MWSTLYHNTVQLSRHVIKSKWHSQSFVIQRISRWIKRARQESSEIISPLTCRYEVNIKTVSTTVIVCLKAIGFMLKADQIWFIATQLGCGTSKNIKNTQCGCENRSSLKKGAFRSNTTDQKGRYFLNLINGTDQKVMNIGTSTTPGWFRYKAEVLECVVSFVFATENYSHHDTTELIERVIKSNWLCSCIKKLLVPSKG